MSLFPFLIARPSKRPARTRPRLGRLRVGSSLMLVATPGLSLTVRAQPAPQGIISMPSAPLLVVPAPTVPAPTPPTAVVPTPVVTQSKAQELVKTPNSAVFSPPPSTSKTIITARGLPPGRARQNFGATLGASTPTLGERVTLRTRAVAASPSTKAAKPSGEFVRQKLVALDESLRSAPTKASTKEPKFATPKTASTPTPAPALAAVTKVAALPRVAAPTAPVLSSTPRRRVLASREAAARELLLARLDAQLAREQGHLQRAETRLAQQQRQLGAFTDVIRSAMLEDSSDGRGLHPFVKVAQRYIGVPYVWGGESARGFDCSGFIMRVMRDLGYKALPHSAAEQFKYGQPVARQNLKAGDIVFFANTYKPGVSHVGIYLGRGRFIHAANSQVGTIVSGLNEPKWVAHYAGARRLLAHRE